MHLFHECRECRKPTIAHARALRYREFDFADVILEGVLVHTCAICGNETPEIPSERELKSAVALLLVSDPRRLSPAEFRFLRGFLEFDHDMLARRLGLRRVTIQRWEAGTQPIGRVGERLLRLMIYSMERSYDDNEEPAEMLEILACLQKGKGPRTLRLRMNEYTVHSWRPCEDRGNFGPPYECKPPKPLAVYSPHLVHGR